MMIEVHKNWINKSYLIIKEKYVEMNNLDQMLGDGDHGTTILKGFDKAVLEMDSISYKNSIEFMSEISRIMRIAMGGASGILMTIFIKEAGNFNDNDIHNSILSIFSNSIEKIKKRGNVNAGDKSILDIYIPLHYEINKNTNIFIDDIFSIIDKSLEATKNMEAKVGRAKFLETKGLGMIDPGAFSTSIILREFFREIYNEKNN